MSELPPPEKTFDKIYEERFFDYTSAVGRVAHSWNSLQESLGHPFAAVTGLDSKIAFAVWYSIKSDRVQREILSGAINATKEQWEEKFPQAHTDIKWLVDKANSLEDQRNDAVHAPCSMKMDQSKDGFSIHPLYYFGNPRAKKLKDKNIMNEFVWYERSGDVLEEFSSQIRDALYSHGAWPQKPLMPTLD